ncbi:LysR family transcriptional regulator [Cognatishimia sp. MH4019]|uniref:LysR family transcriptional regulator n=1 Tax=Cognatishimia sp. MH4019 TaxID=2854030 RepID=UPI001CD36C9E|nr:LysR family transcriptional regulator [Cognatishimia sp. MH4019]
MDRISDLRVFVRLAETLSFTVTAAALGIGRASVARVIARLEKQLGTRLVQRTTRSVTLTPDGAAFLERSTQLISEADAIAGMFARSSERPGGILRVNVPSRMGRLLFAPRLPEFFAQYPDIELDLAVTDRPVDLISEGFDCVVRVGTQKASGLVTRNIGSLDIVNCASPAYLAKYGIPQTLDDLHQHRSIGYVSPRDKRDSGWEYVEDARAHEMRLPCSLRVSNAELYIAAALAGLGLIQVPAYDVSALLAAGKLVEVLPHHPAAPMPVALVAPDRPSLVPTVRVFADWAEKICRDATS